MKIGYRDIKELRSRLDDRIYSPCVTPRFPKYVEVELRRRSATYIREENSSHIYAKPKVT